MPPLSLPAGLKFGPFPVTSSQVFHLSPTRLSYGLVNLKPLLPGHVLICPVRSVPRLSQLSAAETADLFVTAQRVSRTLQRLYAAAAFNVAVQDGAEAGQSVPHVHVHVIPRRKGDYDARGGGDRVYDDMDSEVGELGGAFVELWRGRRARAEMDRRRRDGGVGDGEDGERGEREVVGGGPDSDRVARTEDEMRVEAEWLRVEMEKDAAVLDDEDADGEK